MWIDDEDRLRVLQTTESVNAKAFTLDYMFDDDLVTLVKQCEYETF